jgi:hypothetical protein
MSAYLRVGFMMLQQQIVYPAKHGWKDAKGERARAMPRATKARVVSGRLNARLGED